jgi:hypothetical protein
MVSMGKMGYVVSLEADTGIREMVAPRPVPPMDGCARWLVTRYLQRPRLLPLGFERAVGLMQHHLRNGAIVCLKRDAEA